MIQVIAVSLSVALVLGVVLAGVEFLSAAVGIDAWTALAVMGWSLCPLVMLAVWRHLHRSADPEDISTSLADPDGGGPECQACPFRAEAEQFRHSIPTTDHADQLGGGR